MTLKMLFILLCLASTIEMQIAEAMRESPDLQKPSQKSSKKKAKAAAAAATAAAADAVKPQVSLTAMSERLCFL